MSSVCGSMAVRICCAVAGVPVATAAARVNVNARRVMVTSIGLHESNRACQAVLADQYVGGNRGAIAGAAGRDVDGCEAERRERGAWDPHADELRVRYRQIAVGEREEPRHHLGP